MAVEIELVGASNGAFGLTELAVLPDARGRRIGGRLHDAVLGGTAARTAVTATPRDGNPAVRFYRRRGWHAPNDAFFYPNGATPHLVLGRDLAPPDDRPSPWRDRDRGRPVPHRPGPG